MSFHLLLEQIGALTGMSTVWARLFYLYGPGEDPRRLVASIIRSLLRSESVAISPGEQVRDFLHVDDVAAAIAHIAEGELTGPVNVGSGIPVTVAHLARTVGRPSERRSSCSSGLARTRRTIRCLCAPIGDG